MLKFKGSKKAMKEKKLELFRKGYITYLEQYDKNIWYVSAKLPD